MGRHRRERQRPSRGLGGWRLQESRRWPQLDPHGARALRAHRQDRGGSARWPGRLRRRRGSALGGGRRARALQDGRRRRDVGARPGDRRRHRSHRPGDRSARPGRPLRRLVSAPPPRLGVSRRRSELGHPQVDRRRQELAPHRDRSTAGRHGQDRPGGVAGESRRGLRDHRGRRGGARLLPLPRRWRELGEAQQLHLQRHRSALLPGDRGVAPRRRHRLPDGRLPARHPRRRQELRLSRRRAPEAQRQPRAVDRSARRRASARRHRRLALRELRRRRHLASVPEPADLAVLQALPRLGRALLQHPRRRPGSGHAARPVANDERRRRAQSRLVRAAGGRRLCLLLRPGQPEHRLHGVAGRAPAALRPGEPRDARHPAGAGARRSARALQLGLPHPRQPPRLEPPLLRLAAALAQRRPRRLVDGGERRPDPRSQPLRARADGPGVERRRPLRQRRHVALRHDHHRLGVAARRGAPLRRHRRRPGAGERGRRRLVAIGRVPADLRAAVRQRHPGLAPRAGRRLRRPRQPQGRRLPAPPAGEPRPRPHLEVDRRRSTRPRRRLVARPGSCPERPALCRRRVRSLRLSRPRQEVDAPRRRADDLLPRRRHPAPRERRGRRHLRPRFLRARRLLAPARHRSGGTRGGRLPLPAARRLALRAVSAGAGGGKAVDGQRRLHRAQPALRHGLDLPSE